jgi:SAM-dependent methyltransferase
MNTAIILNRSFRLLQRKVMKFPIGLLTFFVEKFFTLPHFCPCCNRSVPFWLDYDASYKNVVCPFCESHPRHRSLSIFLQRWFENQLGSKKILHIAPENSIAKTLKDHQAKMVVTLDKNKLGVDIKANVEHLPFANGIFDLAICSHVLEHVENDERAMQEIARVLNKNGWAFVGAPLDWER